MERSKYSVPAADYILDKRISNDNSGQDHAGHSHSDQAQANLLPQMLYRKASNAAGNNAEITGIENERFRTLGVETLCFNTTTFVEETATHIGNVLFGPFFAPFAVLISGKGGARITGFWPGQVKFDDGHDDDTLMCCKQANMPTGQFIGQNIQWMIMHVPVLFGLILYLTGRIVPMGSLSTTKLNSTAMWNETEVDMFGFGPPVESDVDFVAELIVPLFIVFLRQVVIAVKYAYIPRGHIRQDRDTGRNMSRWWNELIAQWCFQPTTESAIENAQLGCATARINPKLVQIEFVRPFTQDAWDVLNVPETSKETKAWLNKLKTNSLSQGVTIEKSRENPSKNSEIDPAAEAVFENPTPSSSRISLWFLLKFSVYHGVMRSKKSLKLPMLAAVIGSLIPSFWRIFVLGRPGFGETHLDKWICACSLVSYIAQGSGAIYIFSFAGSIIFNRARMMMDSYFQMLIPITVPDARAIDPPFQIDHFDLIPDMKPSAENV